MLDEINTESDVTVSQMSQRSVKEAVFIIYMSPLFFHSIHPLFLLSLNFLHLLLHPPYHPWTLS